MIENVNKLFEKLFKRPPLRNKYQQTYSNKKEHHEYICIQECHQIIQVNDKVDHNEHRKQIDRNFSEVINPY